MDDTVELRKSIFSPVKIVNLFDNCVTVTYAGDSSVWLSSLEFLIDELISERADDQRSRWKANIRLFSA